ncbi:MAG TPA: Gfo/Idh/MocA family oxidoreductase [Dehalococcoidia bacterium]
MTIAMSAESGEPLGVAVIGTGSIAEAHLYSYQREEDRARLVAVVDVDESRAQAAAGRYGVPDVHTDYHEVLARDDVHALSICAPPFLHAQMSIDGLRAGKHVLCEKPVAPTLSELDRIEEAARKSGAVFSGVFQLRFGKGAEQLRVLLDEGHFGKLHLGIADTLWFRDDSYYDDVSWRGTWEQECGGVTVSQAVHLVDALVWFLGEPRSVFARAGSFRRNLEVDDTSVALIQFEGGALGQVTSTVSAAGPERSRLEIYGSDLSAVSQGPVYDSTSEPFALSSPIGTSDEALQAEIEARVPRGFKLLHRGCVDDFLGAIRDGRPPLADVGVCRQALQVTTAVYKSAMTGQPVDLPIERDDPFYSALPPDGYDLPGVA